MAILKGWDAYYGVPLFDKVFAEAADRHFKKYYKPLLGGLELTEKSTLELGGGTGLISRKIHDMHGTKPTLVDITQKAHERFKQMNGFGVYIIGSALEVDLGEKFDLVFSDGLIEHFSHRKQIQLIEAHKKHCKKGGYVLISAPRDGMHSRIFSELVTYEKGYKPGELSKMMNGCGLEVIRELDKDRYTCVLAKKR